MAQRIDISLRTIAPGAYSHEVLAPARANAARLTMTRQPSGWPAGAVFQYRVFERERNSGVLNLLTRGAEPGGPATGKDGTVNPPFRVTLTWPADRDRDLIRFEVDVVQAFNTAITMEFL